jgi:hypothetical protein
LLSFLEFRVTLVGLKATIVFGYTGPLAVPAIIKGVYVLAVVTKNKVSLAERAAGDELDGVGGTGIVLDDGDEFLILGPVGSELPERGLGNAVPQGKPGAEMAVELDGVPEIIIELSLH